MAYPKNGLDVRIEAAPGADLSTHPDNYPWLDVTPDWRASDPITLKAGGDDEQSETSSGIELSLNNRRSKVTGTGAGVEGRYTSDNPMSDLWPNFGENCPVRVSRDAGSGMTVAGVGYLAEAYPVWPGNSALAPYVDIRADGLFRRLQQGEEARSPLYRHLVRAT